MSKKTFRTRDLEHEAREELISDIENITSWFHCYMYEGWLEDDFGIIDATFESVPISKLIEVAKRLDDREDYYSIKERCEGMYWD